MTLFPSNEPWHEPTLRELLDDSVGAVDTPGRYCDRMAYIIDVACDASGDETFSAGLGGDWYARFGRRLLLVDSSGFVRTELYPRVSVAEARMVELREMYCRACDGDWD